MKLLFFHKIHAVILNTVERFLQMSYFNSYVFWVINGLHAADTGLTPVSFRTYLQLSAANMTITWDQTNFIFYTVFHFSPT